MTDAADPAGGPGAAQARPADLGSAAFVTIDRGTATTAGALVGRVERHWRLLTGAAVPVGPDPSDLVDLLVERVGNADPWLARELRLDRVPLGDPRGLVPRLEARGGAAPRVAVLAATEAARRRLEADAAAAGWRTSGASAERDDLLATTRLATRPDLAAILVGTGDPAAADERDLIGELVALAAGVAERRPGLVAILVGAAAARASDFPLGTEVVTVPHPHGDEAGDLRAVLAGRRAGPGDPRQSLVAISGALAAHLDLRVELLEIGMSGALRVRADPGSDPGSTGRIAAAEVPAAALGSADDDEALDRVEAWTTLGLDRARLRDRLAELRLAPWADLGGDGALLRAAALRAALERLIAATDAELGGPAPDLVVLAGGAWAAVPGPAALLALADGLRRPGIVQVAADPARLLAPLGSIEDPDERRVILADLASSALVPIGTLALPRGVRGGRQAGRLHLGTGDGPIDLDLVAGRLALVDLPPGQAAAVELAFRTPVDLGTRGRRFAVRATGGLAGLVVDLRDVPLRLPERAEERRDLLVRWERALWPERER